MNVGKMFRDLQSIKKFIWQSMRASLMLDPIKAAISLERSFTGKVLKCEMIVDAIVKIVMW